jgi:hypothetical protein
MKSKKLLGAGLLALIVVLIFLSVPSSFGQTNDLPEKVQNANNAIEQAFNEILSAEKAGANVTDLLNRLTYAVGILANAENSYRTGYFDKAAIQADNVLLITQQITISAQAAKQNALISGQNALWSIIAFTVIGVVGFVLALFLFWRWFKRSYMNRLLKAKPEVSSQ